MSGEPTRPAAVPLAHERGWRLLAVAGLALSLLLLPAVALAADAVTVKLAAAGTSSVTGTATFTANGAATTVAISLSGLQPNAAVQATMNAGTCAAPSASFAALPNMTADATGKASASGPVLFRGTENVALSTMADDAHVIMISAGGQTVACAVIPALAGAAGTPAALPRAGALPLIAPALAAALGFAALGLGVAARRR